MRDNTPADFDPDEKPSKSARKREMLALQELGEALVRLSDGDLAAIPLGEDLADAIATARRIKSHEGLRRQLQFIGKLMRRTDTEAIAAAYADLQRGRQEYNREFHELEHLRDTLLQRGVDAMSEVLERFPDADRQHLRQLITAAEKEQAAQKPPAAARKLFRYLRELAGR